MVRIPAAAFLDGSKFKPTRVIDPRGNVTLNGYDKLYRLVSRSQYERPSVSSASAAAQEAATFYQQKKTAYDAAQSAWQDAFDRDQTPVQAAQAVESAAAAVNTVDAEVSTLLADLPTLQAAAEAASAALSVATSSSAEALNLLSAIGSGDASYITSAQAAYNAFVAPYQTAANTATTAHNDAQASLTSLELELTQKQAALTRAQEIQQVVLEAAQDATLKAQLTAARLATRTALDELSMPYQLAQYDHQQAQAALQQAQALSASNVATPAGTTLENTYDAVGNLISVTDPLGRITTNTYDALGQLLTTTYPDSTGIENFYTHTGKIWKSVNEAGAVNLTKYDALDREIKTWAPEVDNGTGTMAHPMTETEYDAAGNRIAVKDPLGRVSRTEFDFRGKPLKVTSPQVWDAVQKKNFLPVTQTKYDALGQVIEVTDPAGAITQKFYDRGGRLWKATDALGRSTISKLDPAGNAVEVINAAGQSVVNEYDLHNRQTRTVDAAGIEVLTVYDAAGNKTAITDGLNQTTNFTYDHLNRLTKQVFPNGDTFRYVYDAVHKLRHIDARGAVTTYQYSMRDKQTETAFYAPGSWQVGQAEGAAAAVPDQVRTMTYNAVGNILTVSETGAGGGALPHAAVAYTYDLMGRIITETSHGVTHGYVYDLAGNRTRASYGTGRVVTTIYDAMNRVQQIREGGRTTSYAYDAGGRAVLLISPNNQSTINEVNALGHITRRWLYRDQNIVAANLIAEFAWDYDVLGNVIEQAERWPGTPQRAAPVRSTTMTYDGANRLVTETVIDPVKGGSVGQTTTTTTSYTYDGANNRLTKTVTGGTEAGHWTYQHNSSNQLVSWQKAPTAGAAIQKEATLTYDGNGNRASQTVTGTPDAGSDMNPPNAAVGVTQYRWDLANRLMGVTLPDGSDYAYQYDYRGRRSGIIEGGTVADPVRTQVSFSEGLSVAEWESSAALSPSSLIANPSSPTVEYQRGPDMGGGIGGLLYSARREAASGSTLQAPGPVLRYNLFNARGDVVAQSNDSRVVTWTASYEAFGRRAKETGSNADKQRANTKDEDPTGLLNEGSRYRDLETGVFLSRDPAGFVDGPNVYTYVQQNPWTKNDPDGLFWHIAAGTVIGGLVGLAAQVVTDVVRGEMSDAATYAGAVVGGAAAGGTLAATGSPTLAGAAGGMAQDATQQYLSTGTVDGGQVFKAGAVGAAGGGLGGLGSKVLGCATSKVTKALGGAAADAASGAGGQVVENVLNGESPGAGVLEAAVGNLPGAGVVTAVQQRESCFLAGTSVTLGTGDHAMIETLHVGQRVSTPESVGQSGPLSPVSGSGSETSVDPATWRSYTVRLLDARTGWDIFDITLLRPAGWMAEHSRQIEGRNEVWVDFEELHAKGWAEVIEERPCPKIAPGPGRVVTATITHANDDVRTLTMNSGEVLYVTGNHRMFSATANDWVPVKALHVGEELRTSKGRESVAALGYQRGRHQVYNIEVEAEHCYFVGKAETLTHNMCGPDGESLALTHTEKPTKGPYSSIPDPKNPSVGGDFTDRQQQEALRLNRERNGGVVRSDGDGRLLEKPLKSVSGVTPSQNEWQFDHIKAKANGGTNRSSNLQILSRQENRQKAAKPTSKRRR